VTRMGEEFFAHRNLLGSLRLESFDGEGVDYPIMEVEPKKIERKRRDYSNLCKSWRELSVAERKTARQNGERRVPRSAGYESYLVKEEGVLAGLDNYFIRVKKNDDGKWTKVAR